MKKLTNEQWNLLQHFFPKEKRTTPKGGRPGHSTRDILDGVLWVMRVGARWNDLPTPKGYPSGTTCFRHFKKWVELDIFDKVIRALVEDLRERGKIDLTETFIDATFVEAKKGVKKSAKPRVAKAVRSWQSSTVDLFLSPCLLRVLHHMRVCSLCPTLRSRYTRHVPRRLIGDKAYDSDLLRKKLRRHRCELIAPHKLNRKKPKTQDGRALRRYRRRWVVERFFSWIQSFRRVKTRYDRDPKNYFGFVQLASIIILLRRF